MLYPLVIPSNLEKFGRQSTGTNWNLEKEKGGKKGGTTGKGVSLS